ncbi:hypothetical protein Droror1_Dr00008972 [Drosera rotundifolia]
MGWVAATRGGNEGEGRAGRRGRRRLRRRSGQRQRGGEEKEKGERGRFGLINLGDAHDEVLVICRMILMWKATSVPSELILTSVSHNPSGYNDYLLSINKELSYIQFELRECRNQYDGKVYYGVVNNVADEQSKIGTKYSVPQITFYKGIGLEVIARIWVDPAVSRLGVLVQMP